MIFLLGVVVVELTMVCLKLCKIDDQLRIMTERLNRISNQLTDMEDVIVRILSL